MPSRMRLGPAESKVSCDRRSEVSHPAAHRLIGHHDAALSQQVLDIPEAEGKPGIEPDGRLNNHGWEAISSVADFAHDRHLWPQISAGKLNNVTMPSGISRLGPDLARNIEAYPAYLPILWNLQEGRV